MRKEKARGNVRGKMDMSMEVRMEESKEECMILDIDCIIRGL